MRKVLTILLIIFILISFSAVWATEINTIDRNTTSELIKEKEKADSKIDEYTRKYGSETYGMAAYVLRAVSIYSIPVCFLGIAVGAATQYAIGTRRLDMRHRGSRMMLAFITLLVIAQVLPLVFALVVRGWKG